MIIALSALMFAFSYPERVNLRIGLLIVAAFGIMVEVVA